MVWFCICASTLYRCRLRRKRKTNSLFSRIEREKDTYFSYLDGEDEGEGEGEGEGEDEFIRIIPSFLRRVSS